MAEHPVDPILIPLGLEVTKTSDTTRRYEMTYKGRRVQVHYQRIYVRSTVKRVTDPSTLAPNYLRSSFHIYVDAPNLKTRAKIGRSSVVMKGIDRQKPVTLDDPAYEGWRAFSLALEWAADLMRDPTAKDLILRLTGGDPAVGTDPAIFIQPGALVLIGNVKEPQWTTDYARQRIDDLVALADAAESLPASYQPVQASRGERVLQEGRSTAALGIGVLIAIVGGILLLIGLCAGAAVVLSIF
jgi:hypothetical protein